MVRFINRSFNGFLVTGLGVLLNSLALANPVYNPVTDFSIVNNPNGAWSLGTENTLGGAFTAFSNAAPNCTAPPSGYQTWWGVGGTCITGPFVGKNATGSTFTLTGGGGGLVQPTDQLNLAPGVGIFTVVRWTAPATDTYAINGFFNGIDFKPTTSDAHVFINGVDSFDATIAEFNSPHFFSFQRSLLINTTIDFIVGSGQDGSSNNDSTGFAGTIASVPEPGAAVLFVFGCGGLLALRKRKGSRTAV